ncbi:hypothetical protein MSC49_33780 [Methylosinus sp. C49]|nr:hypothetical protein MSC49_33780 [Methylosinus sp. C49]
MRKLTRSVSSFGFVLFLGAQFGASFCAYESVSSVRTIDIRGDKTLKSATAPSNRDDDVSALKGELLVIKWMMGLVLAFQVVIAVKLFWH